MFAREKKLSLSRPLIFTIAQPLSVEQENLLRTQRLSPWEDFEVWYAAQQKKVTEMFSENNFPGINASKVSIKQLTEKELEKKRMNKLRHIKQVLRDMNKYGVKFGE